MKIKRDFVKEVSPNMANKCKYFEWDESGFTLPEKYYLEENADLADALNVFWSAGGLDFLMLLKRNIIQQIGWIL